MLGFIGMFFGITCYAATYHNSNYNYSKRSSEIKPTFENIYIKKSEQTKKIFEYGSDEANVKSSNFLIFHKDNDNNSNNNARSIIFSANKKSENAYFYNASNKPEVTDFYNVLIKQKFYKELNDLSENNNVIRSFKPYLIHKEIIIDEVEFLFNRNMVSFLNMLFFKSQKKEEEIKENNASRFDTVMI